MLFLKNVTSIIPFLQAATALKNNFSMWRCSVQTIAPIHYPNFTSTIIAVYFKANRLESDLSGNVERYFQLGTTLRNKSN